MRKKLTTHHLSIILIALCTSLFTALLLWTTTPVQASPQGNVGNSGAFGTTCNDCHFGGMAPLVAVAGKTTVAPSETVLFMLSITSTAPLQTHAGWNVAIVDAGNSNAGTISPLVGDSGSQIGFGELTHTNPLTSSDGVATVSFEWTAPAAEGSYTMYFAGNSVNNNWMVSGESGTAGDMAGVGSLMLVVAEPTQVGLAGSSVVSTGHFGAITGLFLLTLLTVPFARVRNNQRGKG